MIIDIFFILLFLLFPFFSAVLIRVAGLSVFRLSIPSFVLIALFVFSYIGILPLYFGWDEYRYAIGIQDKMLILKILVFSALNIMGVIFGCIAGYSVLGTIHPVRMYGHINLDPPGLLVKISISVIVIICLVVFFVYLKKIPNIALFVALTQGPGDAKAARSLMGNDFGGKYHWYSVFIHDVLNIVTFSLFATSLVHKKSFFIKLFLITSFMASVFAAVMATEKGPVAWLLIGMYIVYLLVRKDGYIPILGFVKISFLLLSILVIVYIFFQGSGNVGLALSSIFSRAFTGQIAPVYYYMEYFPKYHDFLWGASFPNPGHILPYTPYRLTVEIMNWKFPHLVKQGIVGSAPTVYWGELYANFGVLGIFFPPFFVGLYLYILHFLYNKIRPTEFTVGCFAWLIIHLKNLSATGLSSFIIDFYFFVVVIVYGFASFLSGNGKIKTMRS
jgi:hypothetical protein